MTNECASLKLFPMSITNHWQHIVALTMVDMLQSPTAVVLDRFNDVSDDLLSFDGMLSDIEAKIPT